MRGITYTIRSSLYVAVTNRCCTTSLIASRGPGLSMPPSFHPLPADGAEPSAAEILQDVTERLAVRDDGNGNGRGKGVGLFEEVVFAGVGEPLLRWPVVREVVRSLRNRHATALLRPREPSPANAATAAVTDAAVADRAEAAHGGNENSSMASPQSYAAVPIRLVTNGVWPAAVAAATGHAFGSLCPTVDVSGGACTGTGTPPAAAARSESPRGNREGDASGGDEEGAGDYYSAAARAAQAAHSVPRSNLSSERRSSLDTAEAGGSASAASVAGEIAELFDSVSVALNTADPLQYEKLMKPSAAGLLLPRRQQQEQPAHSLVCDLVKECVAQGLPTECTVVDRDGVDVKRAQELAASLGASCRVRPYFPS